MELFLIWLITILISIGINCKYVLAFTKKFADQGIKFKSESSEEGFGQNRISISLLIPFLNLFLSVQNFLNLNNHFEDILYDHQYEVMSRFEKREYAKKKTGFHAFSVFRLYKQLIGQASIFCSEEPEKGEIYFLPIQDDIVILHATGVFIYFSDEELKKKCENVSFAFNREVLQLLEDIIHHKQIFTMFLLMKVIIFCFKKNLVLKFFYLFKEWRKKLLCYLKWKLITKRKLVFIEPIQI